MHPSAVCGCTSRTGATVVAILSIAYIIVDGIIFLSFPDYKPYDNQATTFDLSIIALLMLLSSCLLLAGSIYGVIWMCYPWILSAVINLGEVIILTISELIDFFKTFACIVVIKLMTFILLSGLIIYSMWVVFVFVKEVQEQKKYKPLGILNGKEMNEKPKSRKNSSPSIEQ